MDHLLTTILEDRESLGQQNTHIILLGTASDTTRMVRARMGEEGATEARNKSRCLLALDLLTDVGLRHCLHSPSIPLRYQLCGLGQRVKRVVHLHTRSSHIPASRSLSFPTPRRLAGGRFKPYSGAVFDLPGFACFHPLSICRANLVLIPLVLSLQPNKVYIGGLPEHTRKEDLESCFGKIGTIVNVELKCVHRADQKPSH